MTGINWKQAGRQAGKFNKHTDRGMDTERDKQRDGYRGNNGKTETDGWTDRQTNMDRQRERGRLIDTQRPCTQTHTEVSSNVFLMPYKVFIYYIRCVCVCVCVWRWVDG